MNEKIKEVSYAIAKAGVGQIPIVGGVLAELFSVAFSDPASKRKDQIILEMGERLQRLEQEGFNIQELSQNDEFLTIALQSYNIALRTHQKEKRFALMNAISNTPKLSIDENEKLMMLNYIDSFNEWHLKILSFLDNPTNYFTKENKPSYYMAAKSAILEDAFPELKSKRTFYDQIAKDLNDRGLIVYDTLHASMSEMGLWNSGTSKFGKLFLKFVSE